MVFFCQTDDLWQFLVYIILALNLESNINQVSSELDLEAAGLRLKLNLPGQKGEKVNLFYKFSV